jgi:non-ribosomal peptide synthetase component E (peptide arylation enzyme)
LVEYPDDDGGESPCVVIVPATAPPIALDEPRLHLASQGMTEWDLPTHLEDVESLPRNGERKVHKELLRRWRWVEHLSSIDELVEDQPLCRETKRESDCEREESGRRAAYY